MPDWKSIVTERLESLRLNAAAESDLAEELAQHLSDCYRELLSAGTDEEEARHRTLRELDDTYPPHALKRNQKMPKHEPVPAGDSRSGSLLQDFLRDLRYALRGMRKSPLFVLFVVLTLALGIGANTTVFTIINTLILNPLPVPDSGGLIALDVAAGKTPQMPVSYADFRDYQSRNSVFNTLAAYTSARVLTWHAPAGSERIFGELVTGNYFSTLGLHPAMGRFFLPEEDGAPGAHPVAVMNYGTWQSRFGGANDIVGKTLSVNNLVVTVIGVAPPRFIGVNAIFGPDLWIPASMAETLLPNDMKAALTDRGKANFEGIGRLKSGIALSQAQANITALSTDLARQYPATNEGHTAKVRPVRDVLFGNTGGGTSPILFGSVILLIVVGIVLLIACSNVANLLLARSAARRQEMAVRRALGASRPRLVRQLLTESVLLGILSGIVGFGTGYAGLRILFGMLPAAANFATPKFDPIVFLYALVISLATGFLFGALPAFRASHSDVAEALKEEARTTGRSLRKVTLGNALLVGQVAFSFVLLVTAVLFLRSIGRAYNLDPGFQTAHLAIFMTNPGQAGYGKPQTRAFYKDVRDRVSRNPAIESVSWSSNLPLWSRAAYGLEIEGHEQRSQANRLSTIVSTVDLNYFETAGVTLERGRGFSSIDQETSLPVAIVNEKLARDYWPEGEALGKRIRLPGQQQMRQIVGIARNANYSGWAEAPQLCVYIPLEQNYSDAMILYVRTKADPAQILRPVQAELHAAAPQILAGDSRTGRAIVDGGLFQAKMGVGLLSVFGLLALGLASIGLYGIMAYSVSQRKREIGVRMALGAARSSVLGLILRQGMSLVLTGLAIGFGGSLLAGRLLSRMLYGVSAADPLSLAVGALALSAAALLACWFPARGATRVDPLAALREA